MSTGDFIGLCVGLGVIFALSCIVEGMTVSIYDNFDWLRVFRNMTVTIVGGGLVSTLVIGCHESPWWQAKLKAEAVIEKAVDNSPRMVAEIDGCRVFAFKGGERWHYFTRCPDKTTTEANWTERQGKSTIQKSETITTENK